MPMTRHERPRKDLEGRHYINTIAIALLVFAVSVGVRAAATLYPDVSRAAPDIDAALKEAAKTNRRVLVDFGGNWCGDCIVLDKHLQVPENAELLKKHYVVVHVNVGDKGISHNFDVAERYGIPLKKGVPALAVLDRDGRLVFSQKQGEFESMRTMDPASVGEFLRKWAR
jgi:thioredoxin 1